MEDFVARNSLGRLASITSGSAVFVLCGLWMAGVFGPFPTSSRYSPAVLSVAGWSSVIVFGFAGTLSIRRAFDNRVQLLIGSVGIHSPHWSDNPIPWSEIIDVTTWSHSGQKMILLHLQNKDRYPGRGLTALLKQANRRLTGGDITISLTGSDREFDDALAAIAYFRRGATTIDGGQSR